ncbi:UDP-N-acetylmuramoyl-L-alanyl-D-glutamate--2,6-diaminopimelate ligase [Alicyclobacillus acidocaldarius]|uniref:UDP-N-acetylmuramyl-tripeptide synthetase n=1 Tax=Alicyclobacillus acidocaldarius (strain Tc-4-1) TaxID=1048834 RepID=F8IKY6_ALIAT|nr:UDP-N-acetylmuramoyl-L-alanyl-D-glutamate--2,6-diaminopimelate ligase [Alicyclobacillus acidocaldarius]AEJ42366.1 UDP-N-acetylmuramyl-tripeptide synthetase [Alicyclobacillus acidocaldarius subsp. acidocaldarius Tc-4-1]
MHVALTRGTTHWEDLWKQGRIRGVATDSREVRPGDLYVAIRGRRWDGHAFIREAVARGAVCVVGEDDPSSVDIPPGVPYVQVPSSRRAASALSDRAYGFPSRRLTVVGVTGTNGKTTCVHWLTHMLRSVSLRVGMLSSVSNETGLRTVPAELTTLEAPKLHHALREMVDAGCTHAVIEVSSHGIVQHRTSDVDFDLAIFTNLTREHLDFHGSMENYAAAKARLFSGLSAEKLGAVLNRDDPYADVMAENCTAPIITYGLHSGDVRGRVVETDGWHTRLSVRLPDGEEFEGILPHPGVYNVYNLLAVVGAAHALGLPVDAIQGALSTLPSVPGRMHVIRPERGPTVVVDYAHTPDALYQLLNTARQWTRGRVWLVFGGRGERDKGKRSEMGFIAASMADEVIITTDNPYSEEPARIADEILSGARRVYGAQCDIVLDRAQAIEQAVLEASDGDVVLITGRGHESFQVIGALRLERTDEDMVREALGRRPGAGAI